MNESTEQAPGTVTMTNDPEELPAAEPGPQILSQPWAGKHRWDVTIAKDTAATVYAHRFQIVDGSLVFIGYRKHEDVGQAGRSDTIVALAPGAWFGVMQVVGKPLPTGENEDG